MFFPNVFWHSFINGSQAPFADRMGQGNCNCATCIVMTRTRNGVVKQSYNQGKFKFFSLEQEETLFKITY